MTPSPSDNILSRFIRAAEARLSAAGIDNAALDARVLAAHALRLDRAQLLSQSSRILGESELENLESLIARRVRREPVGRIPGSREFWGLPFGLNEATLEPRPDSETLIETALEWVRGSGIRDQKTRTPNPEPRSPFLRFLDLGTGTGCLLLALLHELPDATGLGVDLASRAVDQARQNAQNLGLDDRAEFRVNDWAHGIDERFDLVISNPPYIAAGEIATLMPEVRGHDPHMALDGGQDGLAAYRLLIPQLPRLLKPGGSAVLEAGEGQAAGIARMLRQSGFQPIAAHRDLNGVERCVAAEYGNL